jgi:heat shock protein HtpX
MKKQTIVNHTLLNALHTALLFAGMTILLAMLGLSFAGVRGLLWAGVFSVPFLFLGQRLSPRIVLRMLGARPLATSEAPGLYRPVQELTRRAHLPSVPRIYYIPNQRMNAFSVGRRDNAAIGVTDGLLRRLSDRELTGVLAHEVTHIQRNDMRVMGFAHLINRVTGMLSSLGQTLLLLNLPLLLLGAVPISWFAILLLIVAPTVSGLLQLALSRTREFDADLGAAQLTGDPVGLAMALRKMEQNEASILERVFFPGYRRAPDPSMFRTHPQTDERVRRLLELTDLEQLPTPQELEGRIPWTVHKLNRPQRPGWTIHGLR